MKSKFNLKPILSMALCVSLFSCMTTVKTDQQKKEDTKNEKELKTTSRMPSMLMGSLSVIQKVYFSKD